MKKRNITAWSFIWLVLVSLELICSHAVMANEGDPYYAVPYRSLVTLQQEMHRNQAKTDVPIAIPAMLPEYEKPDARVKQYITSNVVKKSVYRIGIDSTEDCDYEKCSNLAFIGNTKPWYKEGERPSIPVTLKNGDKASYYNSICGASCSKTEFIWKHDRYYYRIAGVADSKEGAEIANSMTYGTSASKPKR